MRLPKRTCAQPRDLTVRYGEKKPSDRRGHLIPVERQPFVRAGQAAEIGCPISARREPAPLARSIVILLASARPVSLKSTYWSGKTKRRSSSAIKRRKPTAAAVVVTVTEEAVVFDHQSAAAMRSKNVSSWHRSGKRRVSSDYGAEKFLPRRGEFQSPAPRERSWTG